MERSKRDLPKAIREELPLRLKACPFCGAGNLQAERATQENGELGDFNLTCQVCLGQGPPGGTLEEAQSRWNVRG